MSSGEFDIAIVGGGVAGSTAALQAARLGWRCVAFGGPLPGGLLLSIEAIQGLPGHPEGIAGYDLCPMVQEQALDAGADCRADEAISIAPGVGGWTVEGTDGTVQARALVLATGSRLRPLGVPGEERLAGKGLSHCASCDGPLMRGRVVAAVGGGDAACQEALTLAAHASKVHLLVRGVALRAQAFWRRRVEAEPRIEIHLHTRVEALIGESVVRALQVRDAATEAASEIACDGVFVYAGLLPDNRLAAGLTPLDDEGRIVVDAALRCKPRGLFAAGSVRAGHCGQAAAAAADGQAAAWAAHRFLESGAWAC